MLKEEVLVAETPEDGDAGETCVAGGLDINVGVADIDYAAGGRGDAEGVDGEADHIGCGLTADAFPFAYGYLDSILEPDIMEFGDTCLELVADNSHADAEGMELVEGLADAGIETGVLLTVINIVCFEACENLLKQRVLLALRYCTAHKVTHAVAHELTHLVDGALRHGEGAESVVGSVGKVLKGVEQCAVQIPDYCVVFHCFFYIYGKYDAKILNIIRFSCLFRKKLINLHSFLDNSNID